MKPILIAGTSIVILALIAYGIGIITEQRRHRITPLVIKALTVGVLFDVTATTCMIIGSEHPIFTLHGILGYSSLMAMLTETSLAWRHRLRHGDGLVPTALHWYSRIAYGWWVAAFITGGLMVAFST
jgi:hypothetical protein